MVGSPVKNVRRLRAYMSNDVNDFFQHYQKQSAADARVQQQAAFQERIVKQLLRYAGVKLPPLGVVKAEAKQKYGSTDLSLSLIHI